MELKRQENRVPVSKNVTCLQQVTKDNSCLSYIELKVLEFKGESGYQEKLDGFEVCVVVLSGKVTVSDFKQKFEDIGRRESVFDKIPTDSVYMSTNNILEITATEEAKVMLCYSPSQSERETTLISAESVRIERRGKYQNKRLVQNILDDDSVISENLLVVEVYTEGGNWSSYPPHKHDQDNLPHESFLEETYYHEVFPRQGFVFQRVYTDDLLLDETMAVNNGEVVIVPKGYHPVAVAEGYTSYYLNIMAGPTKKWKFYNDPKHEWIIDRD